MDATIMDGIFFLNIARLSTSILFRAHTEISPHNTQCGYHNGANNRKWISLSKTIASLLTPGSLYTHSCMLAQTHTHAFASELIPEV